MKAPEIFLVDDDKEDQLIMLDYFNDIGLSDRVRFFDNGEMTINYLEQNKDDATLPGLIVLDLNMPVLNGTQTLLHLKRDVRYKHIPVIIFSTSENDEERRKSLGFGAVDYLVKPMNYEEGEAIVKRFASYLS